MMEATISQDDKYVAITATIRRMIDYGSKTFVSSGIAKECRRSGVDVTGSEVGQYLSQHPNFVPFTVYISGYRWQLVGDL